MAQMITPERKERKKLLQDAGINDVEGVQELFKETVGTVLRNGLEGELDDELGYSKYDYQNKQTDNSRNAHSEKTLKTSLGDLEISIPRDRKGKFDPQLVKKNQTSLSGHIEEKILSMYAKGVSANNIEGHIRDIYGLSVSDTTISRITDKILPVVIRVADVPAGKHIRVVFLDAIHFHVRS